MNIRVAMRVRCFNDREIANKDALCVKMEG